MSENNLAGRGFAQTSTGFFLRSVPQVDSDQYAYTIEQLSLRHSPGWRATCI